MRAVIQRVAEAAVEVNGEQVSRIGKGLLVLVAAMDGDTDEDARRLAKKIVELRLFEGPGGPMDRSLLEEGGSMLVVSQFTLAAGLRKGRRPEFTRAAPPQRAAPLVESFERHVSELGVPVATGVFRARMRVSLVNEGPVTFVLDTDLLKAPRKTARHG